MTDDLYDEIQDALKARGSWETLQAQYWKMRHQGLRRSFKPYPGASDMHYPLGDRQIEKLKPFWFQQIYANENVASFVSEKQQDPELTTAAAFWFDYQVKQNSNFEREILIAIDHMGQTGGAPFKVFWDMDRQRLGFDAIDPNNLIVPDYTQELKDADWIVHVIPFSVAAYKRKPMFKKDADFIKAITGKGAEKEGINTETESARESREGITYGAKNQIIVWEVYTRLEPKGGWMVETISPLRPKEPIRAAFKLPYNKGVFAGSGRPPFMRFPCEVKEKGYYSPRGIMERCAPFEVSLCKSWNSKHDAMDYANVPTYSSDQPLTNASNVSLRPGSILPTGLRPNSHPAPPISWDTDMNFTRALAEDIIGTPDFGVVQDASGARPGGNRTATEINAKVGMSGQSNDIRARVFRLYLAEALNMAWSLLCQYSRENFAYVLYDERKQFPVEGLHEKYLISPSGSADSWNKGAQQQKAVNRLQMFRGDPYVKQGPLVKSVLALDEPRLVTELYQEPADAQAGEMEEQHNELLLMLNRFAAAVDPADDDKVHLTGIVQWWAVRSKEPEPLDPIASQLIFKHIQDHGGNLKQKKDPQLGYFDRLLKPISAALLQISQAGQANVVPMQQGEPAGFQPPSPAPPVAPALQGAAV